MAPLNLNIDVPSNCTTLDPQSLLSEQHSNILLFCAVPEGRYELIAIPIEQYKEN